MLWYLHLCANAGLPVTAYQDDAEGEMVTDASGAGRFSRVLLKPRVTVAVAGGADPAAVRERALAAHQDAHRLCFVANSVACPVEMDARIDLSGGSAGEVKRR
jgi:organic hydroperoxide reductase OsmC/OhrA